MGWPARRRRPAKSLNRPLILLATYIPCWTEPNHKVTWGLGRGEGVQAGGGQSHAEGGEHQAFGVLVEVAREELGWVYCVLMALSAKLLSTLATRNLRGTISSAPPPLLYRRRRIFTTCRSRPGGPGVEGGGPTLGLVHQDGSCRSCINCKHLLLLTIVWEVREYSLTQVWCADSCVPFYNQ